jgi:integrase/recombinase XerD
MTDAAFTDNEVTMGTPAKVLTPGEVRRLMASTTSRRHGLRDRALVTLSFKAGLRACEIAGLDWSMVLGPDGRIGNSIEVAGDIAKNGRGRRLPLHPELKSVLSSLHVNQCHPRSGPVIRSQQGDHMTPKSVVNLFRDLYRGVGLEGCSSHSGRRTFITRAARIVSRAGGSLRDVQELAGHRSLNMTERYIEGDRDAQRKLVRML